MCKIKLIFDFFRMWIKCGDRKEAWQDVKVISDKKTQKELEKSMKKYFDNWDNGIH